MKMNDAYPSRYLKADADVPEEGNLVLTIDRVEIETLGQGKDAEDKPVVYFRETAKGLVLNRTNWGLIEKALGDGDTDNWEGKKIALYSADVQFGSDMMRGIRVQSRSPKGGTPASAAPRKKAVADAAHVNAVLGDEETDDIPF